MLLPFFYNLLKSLYFTDVNSVLTINSIYNMHLWPWHLYCHTKYKTESHQKQRKSRKIKQQKKAVFLFVVFSTLPCLKILFYLILEIFVQLFLNSEHIYFMHYTQVTVQNCNKWHYTTTYVSTRRHHHKGVSLFKGQLITANVCVNQNIFDWPSILKSKYSTQLLSILWFTRPLGA